jgi:hypothetical protein
MTEQYLEIYQDWFPPRPLHSAFTTSQEQQQHSTAITADQRLME